MHAIHFPKSNPETLHRNRKARQRAGYKKTTRIKGKEMLRLAQHDKGAERKIGVFVIPSKGEGSLQRIEEKRAMRCYGDVYPYKSGLSTTV